jgi:hypothetical protein
VLKIPEAGTDPADIMTNVQYESSQYINDKGHSDRKERRVYKEQADLRYGDIEPFPQVGTDSERTSLKIG